MSVCLFACLLVCWPVNFSDPPPENDRISKIPKPKRVSAHFEQLFFWGPPPPTKGENFLTPDLAWYMFGPQKFFSVQNFFLFKIFFSSNFELKIQIFRPFHRIQRSICQPSFKLIDTFSREFWPFKKWIFSTLLYILEFSNGHNSLNKLDRHMV